MTNLLVRLFVKDYRHPDTVSVRTAIGSLAGLWVSAAICCCSD